MAFFQGEANGSGTGALGKAGQGIQETGEETQTRLQEIQDSFRGFYEYLISAEFISNVIVTAIIAVLGVLFYETVTRGIPLVLRWRRNLGDEPQDAETIARRKRQDTAITLARNALRYVIFAVVVVLAVGIFVRNPLGAAAGATVLAAVLGFGAQSFLRDIIAGFSILFEGQYSVGDFVQVEPTKVSGVVEEFGLRTTRIRALSGEVIFIPNGTITGVTNYVSGQQRFTLEVQVNDAEAAERVIGSLGEASELYLAPPRLAGREELDGRVRLRILAGVLPSMAWLVEENLTGRIKAAAGEESLAAEPLIYKVDRSNLRRIRKLIPRENEKSSG